MSSTINGNMWYLSSGYSGLANRHVFSVCLDELVSQAVSESAGASSPPILSPWQSLADVPNVQSTILTFNGALLAIGGEGSSAIHHYQPSSGRWIKVSDLPAKLSGSACVTLPSDEIFLAGGRNEEMRGLYYSSITNRVVISSRSA